MPGCCLLDKGWLCSVDALTAVSLRFNRSAAGRTAWCTAAGTGPTILPAAVAVPLDILALAVLGDTGPSDVALEGPVPVRDDAVATCEDPDGDRHPAAAPDALDWRTTAFEVGLSAL